MEVTYQLHELANLLPQKDSGTHWREGWMGPRASLDTVAKTKRFFPCPY